MAEHQQQFTKHLRNTKGEPSTGDGELEVPKQQNAINHYHYTGDNSNQGGRSERRTHGGNKCKHTRARDVTHDNLAKNSL